MANSNASVPKLVVTEKNNAAVRIGTILSNGQMQRSYLHKVPLFEFDREGDRWTVIGLRGHILNLDYPEEYNRWEHVNPRDLIWIEPRKVVTAFNIVRALKEVAAGKDEVIVATDYDREGELIGVESLDILKTVNPRARVRRARFSALTKVEIEDAFRNLADVDYHLAESAESRQLIDLAWGAVLTRFISLASHQTGKDFLSVGRVQSPALALVVDREQEIETFVPQPFWVIQGHFRKEGEFRADHEHGRFWSEAEALAILERVKGAKQGVVETLSKEEKAERPPSPFNTTSFLAEANRLGFSAYHAMLIAEDLYTNGLISYPRTDNTVYPPSLNLRNVLERLRNSPFREEAESLLSQERLRATRGRQEATDHPPIYPAAAAPKNKLRPDHWKIYELVVRRFFATVAPDCIVEETKAAVVVKGERFLANGRRIVDSGWRAYYPYWSAQESILPPLAAGDAVDVLGIRAHGDETKPPPRYTQGSLLQLMDQLGLGTKSTRHEIIQKLYERGYITGRTIRPTVSGTALVRALETHAEQITKAEMTALLEKDMEAIAAGGKEKDEVVRESQTLLDGVVEVLQRNEAGIKKAIQDALRKQNLIGPCKKCGTGQLLLMKRRDGGRFIGCSNYPACRAIHNVPQTGSITPLPENCETCGGPTIKTFGPAGTEVVCVDAECPSVRDRHFLGKCECGGDQMVRHSQAGKRFVGCTNYPTCQRTQPLPQRGFIQPTKEKCEHCGNPIIRVLMKGRKPWVLCVNFQCPGRTKRAKTAAAKRGRPRARSARGARPPAAEAKAPLPEVRAGP